MAKGNRKLTKNKNKNGISLILKQNQTTNKNKDVATNQEINPFQNPN